ncbi:MAG: hypothetical protein WDN24_12990 [Sphingomonas sp.]
MAEAAHRLICGGAIASRAARWKHAGMPSRLTPMIHVPDVRAAAAWYLGIGFTLGGWHACDADALGSGPLPPPGVALDWALVRWEENGVMFSADGSRSDAARREFDLYIDLGPGSPDEGVDALYARIAGKAEIVEPPYDAFHGNRELILRDLNGFWITFAQPVKASRA